MAFLDGTRVTRDALPPLVPPCAAAGHARRAAWRMEGKPRTARRLPVDPPGPLPTPAARRCCWRPSLQPGPLAARDVGRPRPCPAAGGGPAVALACGAAVGTGAGRAGVPTPPRRQADAADATPGPGADAGAGTGPPGPARPPAAD